MNRYSKIIVCAVLTTALFVCSAFSSFAYGETSSDYIYTQSFGGIAPPELSVNQYSTQVLGELKSVSIPSDSNASLGFFAFSDYGMDLSPEAAGFRVPPFVAEPFYEFASPYNKSGYAFASKPINLYDLAYIGAYCVNIDFLVAVGLQDYTGIDMDRVSATSFRLRFSDGSQFPDGIVDQKGKFEIIEEKELHRYMHMCDVGDTATEVPFDLKLFHVRYTFFEPFPFAELPDTSLYFEYIFGWNGLPPHYIRLFSACSPAYVDYVTAENIDTYVELLDDEEMQKELEEAEKVVEEKREEVAEIIEKLDSPKPSDGDVDSVLDGIDVDSITVVGDFISITDNSDSLFSRFIVSVSVSVLGVAFIGYVLHGKRG